VETRNIFLPFRNPYSTYDPPRKLQWYWIYVVPAPVLAVVNRIRSWRRWSGSSARRARDSV